MSRTHNLDACENGASRGVNKQKYPLDDYLINTNTQTCTEEPLLSPVSPLCSPETVDVLRNAERLVKSAQKKIMEVDFNSTLNILNEDPPSYVGQQLLDDSLLYVREIIESKFQESNDPNKSSNRNLHQVQYPVKEVSRIPNKPLAISEQDSLLAANLQRTDGMPILNKNTTFKTASNLFKLEPPKYLDVFSTSTTCNPKAISKGSCSIPPCTMTNTGVIEINSQHHSNGTIQMQTGPMVDIRGALTIQTVENFHISPDPTAVPMYNNVATYNFQHQPSTSSSFIEPSRTHGDKDIVSSSISQNAYDATKERHIQSTDYTDVYKVLPAEKVHNAETSSAGDTSYPRNGVDRDIIRITDQKPMNKTHNYNHNNNNRYGEKPRDSINASESLPKKLSSKKILRDLANDVKDGDVKQDVSINLTTVRSGVSESLPVITSAFEFEKQKQVTEESNLPERYSGMSSNAISYGDAKFNRLRSDKDYEHRSKSCGDEYSTGSCSRRCERDVEYREKEKFKEALERMTNVTKHSRDIKDTAIVPPECTQICEDKGDCHADTLSYEFESPLQPEHLKISRFEGLCAFSENTGAPKIDTNWKTFKEAIDTFVKLYFDSNSQPNFLHEHYSPVRNSDNKHDILKQHSEMKKGMAACSLKHTNVGPESQETNQHQPSQILKPKIARDVVTKLYGLGKNIEGLSTCQLGNERSKKPNTYSRSPESDGSQLPATKVAQQTKESWEMNSNKQKYDLENLELKEPCVSDIDAVLKVYRQSIAAICQGTDQLAQLISNHLIKNTLPTSDQLSSTPLNSVHCSSEKVPENLPSTYEKSFDEGSNQIHAKNLTQQKYEKNQFLQHKNYASSLREDTKTNNDTNSLCGTDRQVSTANEYSSTFPEISAECLGTTSNNDEKSNAVGSIADKNIKSCTTKSNNHQETSLQTAVLQSELTQHGDEKTAPKSSETQIMDLHYCMTQPSEALSANQDKPNKYNPLGTYLHLENACGKDTRLFQHSHYDIHSEDTADFNLFKCPVLISPLKDNFFSSNNDHIDDMTAEGNIIITKEIEHQVFRQILDAVKNSSQFVKQFIISLLNGRQFDSINDITTILADAAVHPIIIQQFLIILKERRRKKSEGIFGESLTLIKDPIPEIDNWRTSNCGSTDLTKTSAHLNSLESSVDCNDGMKTINTHISKEDKEDKEQAAFHGNIKDHKMNLDKLRCDENHGKSVDNANSQSNTIVENKLQNFPVKSGIIPNKNMKKTELSFGHCQLSISKPTIGMKSDSLFEPLLTIPHDNIQPPVSDSERKQTFADENILAYNCQETENKSLQTGTCQIMNNTTTNGRNVINTPTYNSLSENTVSKRNDSNSKTDKGISSLISQDVFSNKFVDLSDIQKLAVVPLQHETASAYIAFKKEGNSVQRDSLTQNITKIDLTSSSVKSSVAINKSDRNMKVTDHSASCNASAPISPHKDDKNLICNCQSMKDHEAHRVKTHHILCQSSVEAVNALIISQIQSNYKQLGYINPEEKTVLCGPDEKSPSNKRSKPSKLGPTSKSHMRKAADLLVRAGGKNMKSSKKKAKGAKTVYSNNKLGAAKGITFTARNKVAKSDPKNGCLLCTQFQGKCSCLDCSICIGNSKIHELDKGNQKLELDKFVTTSLSPREYASSAIPKEYIGGKYSLRKNNPAMKSGVVVSSSSSTNNDKTAIKRQLKSEKMKKMSQTAASTDTDNSKSEYGLQGAKFVDKTVCTTSEASNMEISTHLNGCQNSTILHNNITIANKSIQLSPKVLDNITEIHHSLLVTETGTQSCLADCLVTHDSQNDHANCDKSHMDMEAFSRFANMNHVPTAACQTLKVSNDFHKELVDSSIAVSEEQISVSTPMCTSLFHDENVVVLQPLNEVDHTFFIAKPNCVERKIIQQKLNRNFNSRKKEMIQQNSVQDCKQHHKDVNSELPYETKSEECQVGFSVISKETDHSANTKHSSVAFANSMYTPVLDATFGENDALCSISCVNDDDRLNTNPSSVRAETDNLSFGCSQNCANEETCLQMCQPKSEAVKSVQNNSTEINRILNKFIAENQAQNIELPIIKALIQELKKVEDVLKVDNRKLGTIYEQCELRPTNHYKSKIENAHKPVEQAEPRGNTVEAQQKGLQYDGPDEKFKDLMGNRKSLILPNVVRALSDMHHKKLEKFRLHSVDPLVPGIFNKPESDRRYSVFHKSDVPSSSVDFNDPRIKAHLTSVAQIEQKIQKIETSLNSPNNDVQSLVIKTTDEKPETANPNKEHISKLNKSKRGMDADFSVRNAAGTILTECDNNSMKSFESSDLEPGEFLQVRTPLDNPTKSRHYSRKFQVETEQLSKDSTKCYGLCNNDTTGLVRNTAGSTNTKIAATMFKKNSLGNSEYKLYMVSTKAIYARKRDSFNGFNQSETICSDRVTRTADRAEAITHKTDQRIGASNYLRLMHDDERQLDAGCTTVSRLKNFTAHKLRIDKNVVADSFENVDGSHLSNKTSKALNLMTTETVIENAMQYSNRPQIIDHFLGKSRLEDMKIDYINNSNDMKYTQCLNFRDNCQRLYQQSTFKSKITPADFEMNSDIECTSKLFPNLENDNTIENPDLSRMYDKTGQFNRMPRMICEIDVANSNHLGNMSWDQTSSETCSEGEINLQSSCSYSMGEIKISTSSNTITGRTVKDSDAFSIFVTKSVDSTYTPCTSPGEILADIQKSETDISSSIS